MASVFNFLLLLMCFVLATGEEATMKDIVPVFPKVRKYKTGNGMVVSSCDSYGSNYYKENHMCYKKCKPGFSGAAQNCVQDCPPSFRDDGLYCAKPSAYGRGAGSFSKCKAEEQCEQWGLLWYSKCRDNFQNFGCCLCSPVCPAGWEDIGVSCKKPMEFRGYGLVLKCKNTEEYSAGLCYEPCHSPAEREGMYCYINP